MEYSKEKLNNIIERRINRTTCSIIVDIVAVSTLPTIVTETVTNTNNRIFRNGINIAGNILIGYQIHKTIKDINTLKSLYSIRKSSLTIEQK